MSNMLVTNSYIDYFNELKEEIRMTPNARFTEFLTLRHIHRASKYHA